MIVRYFSPIFKEMIGMQTAMKSGQDAWAHVIRCLSAHEMSDMEVRDFGEFELRPYDIEQAVVLADVGKNVSRLRPWD